MVVVCTWNYCCSSVFRKTAGADIVNPDQSVPMELYNQDLLCLPVFNIPSNRALDKREYLMIIRDTFY